MLLPIQRAYLHDCISFVVDYKSGPELREQRERAIDTSKAFQWPHHAVIEGGVLPYGPNIVLGFIDDSHHSLGSKEENPGTAVQLVEDK